MSRYLDLVACRVTTGPAIGKLHDGTTFTNNDFPVGTILAQDRAGDLFRYDSTMIKASGETDLNYARICFEHPHKVFRDFWTYVDYGPGTPYHDSIIDAEHVSICGEWR